MGNEFLNEQIYKLTIIMSNYNQGKFIEKAIESVLNQKVSFRYKLLIVDDCSTENSSIEIIKKYSEKYKNIEAYFATKNGGYLQNILRAKEVTKTDYFCLLDADDYWTDFYWLQRAYDFLEGHPEYVVYESNVNILEENNNSQLNKKRFVSRKYKRGTYCKEDLVSFRSIPVTQTTGMFFRNVIFKKGIPLVMKNAVGTLSERSFEGDADRFFMHLKWGKAYYVDDVVGVYRRTDSGIWVRLPRSQQLAITARTFIDYYSYYESNIDFFVTRAYETLQEYYTAKKEEVRSITFLDEGISAQERANINDIYDFCRNNSEKIHKRKHGMKSALIEICEIIRKCGILR